ncbi:M1 family metallopeptidase [Algoriphagus sp.]|uniref:M1 family metallopeptidase n=1 Tax=Algoriphagus sp. TaxID=1872435 RepID=UPI002636EA36|nr:M1 family metallopeptidase [Algoriphagus sp.]
MKKHLNFITLLFFCFSALQAQSWDWGGPMDPLQTKFKVLQYRLDLEILPDKQMIQGSNIIVFEAKEKLDTLRLQLIDEYEVEKVLMEGKELEFFHQNDVLDILPVDCSCNEVEVVYLGKTPIAQNPPWSGGFTWEKDQLGNHWMGLSSQGEGAKIFMPALDHPSSEPSQGVELTFTVPKPYFVAANGRLMSEKFEGDKAIYHWLSDYPINNYNVNFTVGIFHEQEMLFESSSGQQIPMIVYVLQENKAKAPALLSVLEESARTHEKYFGPYPFPEDKIAVVETPYLGMEHQTINAYGNNFQFVPLGDTQYDWLLHHELGHEWFGNKISVGDWADMWIHEGLTAYGDWLFYWEHGGEDAYFEKVAAESRHIPHDRPVVSSPNSTEKEAYHPEIYSKGAMLIHSLRGILGDEVFFPMLKAFVADERFGYQNRVNTQDFTEFVKNYADRDLDAFFDFYLYTTQLPELVMKKKGKKGWSVSLKGINFTLPVEVNTEAGIQKIELGEKPVLIKGMEEPEVDPKAWLMLERK